MKTQEINELKKRFRRLGININSIKNENGGIMVSYYRFDEIKKVRFQDKKCFLLKEELIGWETELENN